MSHLTEDQIDALQASGLPRETPYLIQQVSMSQFSIAQHYGGIKFNGASYTYIPTTDELVRDDVMKWLKKSKRQPAAKAET